MRPHLYLLLVLLLGCCSRLRDAGTLPGAPTTRRFPVTVAWAMADDDSHDDLGSAIEWWNDELGFEALVEIGVDGPDADVIVVEGSAGPHLAQSNPRSGRIQIEGALPGMLGFLVIAHELGHAALWLADDDELRCSVMHRGHDYDPLYRPDAWGRPAPAFPCFVLTENDRRRVRGMFDAEQGEGVTR